MKKRAICLLALALVLVLTGCTPPHANAKGEPGSDIIVLDNGHDAAQGGPIVVTLKPVPTPSFSPTPSPVETKAPLVPTATPEAPTAPVTPGPPDQNAGEGQKTVYLTFDDGPSKLTDEILQILSDKGVTATFFVIGDKALEHPDHILAIAKQGSMVANHSQTHRTDDIYQSAEAFLEDLDRGRQTIASILGDDYVSDLIRFPYGSTNRRCRDYRDDVTAAGYRYFDWNALNGDAEKGKDRTASMLYDEFVETVDVQAKRDRNIIVLMHDTNSKQGTVEMLPDAIDYLMNLGYTFDTLEYASMN